MPSVETRLEMKTIKVDSDGNERTEIDAIRNRDSSFLKLASGSGAQTIVTIPEGHVYHVRKVWIYNAESGQVFFHLLDNGVQKTVKLPVDAGGTSSFDVVGKFSGSIQVEPSTSLATTDCEVAVEYLIENIAIPE